ncbi:MAG: class I SAM-dependent methyltransferase [Planctomycetes bacterium]|nr:class I SAM-dependent methyltransferase [Planctomycetota bacterium]
MTAPTDQTNDDLGRVDGILGEITDSSSLFTVNRGQTYKEFWNNVSTTRLGANFAVVGTAFDEDPTDESLILHGEPEVQILTDKLHLGPESRVLEIGAGVGRLAYHMASRCGAYVGGDISANMLDIARENCQDHDNTEFVELAEASPLPFGDASFDAVYAQAVFIHLDREDCFNYMREAFRVLRPGGRVYFQFFNLLHDEGFKIFDWVARNTVSPAGKIRGRVHQLPAPEVRCYTERAGFVVDDGASHLELRQQAFDYPIPTVNWDYYLVAVGTRPLHGGGEAARLLPEADRIVARQFSDDYCNRCRDGFFDKTRRHALADQFEPMRKYLAALSPMVAFECIVAIERGVIDAGNARVDPMVIFPALLLAATEKDEPATLPHRVRSKIEEALRHATR